MLVLIAAFFIGICSGLRCFVDHQATQSVDCGPHSGCIKVAEKNITNLSTKSWYEVKSQWLKITAKSLILQLSNLGTIVYNHATYFQIGEPIPLLMNFRA